MSAIFSYPRLKVPSISFCIIFGGTYMTTGLDQLDDDQRGDWDGDGDGDDDDEKSEQEQNKSCLNFWN